MTGYKLCTAYCHSGPRWLPVVYFRARERTRSGYAIALQSWCETCQRIHIRVREGLKRRGRPYEARKPRPVTGIKTVNGKRIIDREQQRRYKRQKHHEMTPAQRQDRREYQRIAAEIRRRAAGIPPREFKNRNLHVKPDQGPRLPVDPFADFLKEYIRAPEDIPRLARLSGVDPERLRRIIKKKDSTGLPIKYVSLRTVDRVALALGRPEIPYVLYPDS